MARTKKFVPMKVHVDEQGYKYAEKLAQKKLEILWAGMNWCKSYIDTDAIDRKSFIDDMVLEFRRCVQQQKGALLQVKLTDEKLLFLLDINDSPLSNYAMEFNKIDADVKVKEDDYYTVVDIENYTRYTKSNEENEKIIRGNNLIKALDLVGKYTKVLPFQVQQATSNFLSYDISGNSYRINV